MFLTLGYEIRPWQPGASTAGQVWDRMAKLGKLRTKKVPKLKLPSESIRKRRIIRVCYAGQLIGR